MRTWHQLPEERTFLYNPIGLRLIDDFIGKEPFGSVKALLDLRDDSDQWQETQIKATVSSSGIFSYPGLGRSLVTTGLTAAKYRIRLIADFYLALYRHNSDGIEFDVHPYNHSNPPSIFPKVPRTVIFTPATNYPFENNLQIVRGMVEDSSGNGVPDVLVTEGVRERVLTDDRGGFSLPLRWPGATGTVVIDATNDRNGQTGQVTIVLPNDLNVGHKIILS